MNKLLVFSLLLLCIFPLAAMEQDGNDRGQKRLGEEINENAPKKQKTELKSLVDCCKQFMKRERKANDFRSANADEKDMEKILSLTLPLDITCHVLANVHQSVFNTYENQLGQLLTAECNDKVKEIIVQRLSNIHEYAHLFNDNRVSFSIKCKLIERIPALQTIEYTEQLAEQGNLTDEVIQIWAKLCAGTYDTETYLYTMPTRPGQIQLWQQRGTGFAWLCNSPLSGLLSDYGNFRKQLSLNESITRTIHPVLYIYCHPSSIQEQEKVKEALEHPLIVFSYNEIDRLTQYPTPIESDSLERKINGSSINIKVISYYTGFKVIFTYKGFVIDFIVNDNHINKYKKIIISNDLLIAIDKHGQTHIATMPYWLFESSIVEMQHFLLQVKAWDFITNIFPLGGYVFGSPYLFAPYDNFLEAFSFDERMKNIIGVVEDDIEESENQIITPDKCYKALKEIMEHSNISMNEALNKKINDHFLYEIICDFAISKINVFMNKVDAEQQSICFKLKKIIEHVKQCLSKLQLQQSNETT